MSISGMMMVQAAEARRRRDERGRYMEGGQDDMRNEMRMPRNANDVYPAMADAEESTFRSRINRQREAKGEGYFVWDNAYPQHMPPERYGSPETAREARMTYSPYGDQPDIYKRQEDRKYAYSEGRRMNDDNVVSLGSYAHKADPLDQRKDKMHMAPEKHTRQIGFQSNGALDKQTIMDWVENMEDSEGVRGGKYTWHQTQQYAMNKGITGEKRMLEFYAAMNAMYADFHEAGKKFGVDKPDFYACLAKLFIEDPDAVDNKLEEYYKHVVRHEK